MKLLAMSGCAARYDCTKPACVGAALVPPEDGTVPAPGIVRLGTFTDAGAAVAAP